MSSLWDDIGEEEAAKATTNVVPISDDMPDWMSDMSRYGEQDEPVAVLELIDPATWAGTQAPVRRWKVKDYIPDGQATLLTGKGAAGKSLVSQLQATCIAMGLPFLGLEVEQTNALYITCEDDQDELHRRQIAICEGLGISLESLSGKLFLRSLMGELNNELATFTPDGRMSVAPRYREIQDACSRFEIGFMVLDNTAHLFTGNENDRHQVAGFINLCNRLAVAISGAAVIVGHPNKRGDSFSGSTAWENQVRSRLFMEIPETENGEIMDADMRVIRREKTNYAQRGGELRFAWSKGTFKLPEDAVERSPIDLSSVAADAKDNALFLACMETRNKQRRPVSEQRASRTYAPKEFADMAESKGIGRVRLERAMDRLFRLGAIERGFLFVDKGEGRSRFGIKHTPPKASADLSADVNVNNEVGGESFNIKPLTSKSEVGGKSNEIIPLTSSVTSADLGKNPDLGGKVSNIKPLTSPLTSEDDLSGKSNDFKPLTPDIHPPLYEGDMGKPTTWSGGLPNPLDGEGLADDSDEPPAWMDDAPPIDPDAWRDNPILNPDWNKP